MSIHAPEPQPAPVTKSADLSGAFDEFMTAFESFKQTNDDRLAELETRGGSDPVTTEKLDRIDRALDDAKRRMDALVLKASRPGLGPDAVPARSPAATEHKTAFDAYIRHGDEAGLRRLDVKAQDLKASDLKAPDYKAMSVGSSADGGYLVPVDLDREVGRRLAAISPIRALATVREVSGSVYQKPFSAVGPAAGWVAETGSRPETTSPPLTQLSFATGELYAMPSATAALLDDAVVDLEAWLADEIDQIFAEQEGTAFVSGNGTNKPKGFLTYPTVANAAWVNGSLGYIATGTSGALPATNPSDKLVDIVYALKAGYRQNASWVMSRKVQAEIRKLKDTTGMYLWQPPATAGREASLLGFPLIEAEDMPAIAADSLSIAFGDFRRGYLVVDRQGIRVLRDPYSAKPYVLFYTTKRVGGGVQDFDAIKFLKFGTS